MLYAVASMKATLPAVACFLSHFILTTQFTVIKIGHIYRYPSEVQAIKMAYDDLKQQNRLPGVYDFRYSLKYSAQLNLFM